MSVDNLPPHAWFAAPEGVYTLVSTMNTTVNTNPNPFMNQNVAQASGATPNAAGGGGGGAVGTPGAQLGAAGGSAGLSAGQGGIGAALTTDPAPMVNQPPPLYPSKVTVASVRFPVKDSDAKGAGGFGMTMGRRGGGARDPDANGAGNNGANGNGTSDGSAANGVDGATGPNGANGVGGAGGVVGSNAPLASPAASKRKPLTSSFSMLGGLNTFGDSTANVSASRPSRALKGTTSSFVRSWEGLPLSQVQLRMIAEANSGRDTLFAFQTMGKGVFWNEVGKGKKDALSRIIFSSFPTCLHANQHTASHTQIDLLIGFSSGDILWIDPLTAKYTRLNKQGIITSSAVTSISWLPPASSDGQSLPSTPSLTGPSSVDNRSSNLFVTSHADGTVLIWDREREDWNGFVARPQAPSSSDNGSWNDARVAHGEEGKAAVGREGLVVSKCPALDKKGQSTAKFNPVSHWKVSKQAINAVAVSPDLQLCATVGEDGCLRIIDFVEEKLLDSYASYFGSLTCVSWSPDGRFLVTGGQDDLLTVYAPLEQHLVAHCIGHASWVSGVAWDPWRTEERTMRFVSIGEDCKLILWDLSSAALTRPKAHAHTHHRRHSASSQLSLHRRSTGDLDPYVARQSLEREGPVFHPAPRRDDCSVLQPVMVKTLSHDLLMNVALLPDYIVLGARGGQISQYDRPPSGDSSGLHNEFAASVIRIDARAR
ncbi:hypothetical protein JCM10212_005696 [Sporobolomyces blumeae]